MASFQQKKEDSGRRVRFWDMVYEEAVPEEEEEGDDEEEEIEEYRPQPAKIQPGKATNKPQAAKITAKCKLTITH